MRVQERPSMAIRLTESKLRQIIREEISDMVVSQPVAPRYPMTVGRGYSYAIRGMGRGALRTKDTYDSNNFTMPDGSSVPSDMESFMAVAPFILIDRKKNGNFSKWKLDGEETLNTEPGYSRTLRYLLGGGRDWCYVGFR